MAELLDKLTVSLDLDASEFEKDISALIDRIAEEAAAKYAKAFDAEIRKVVVATLHDHQKHSA